jgi:MFS family permease
MRRHIYTGCMGSVWANLVTGIIFVYFGNAIGLTRLQWGILGAITSWAIVAQPLGAVLGERFGSRKRVWFWFAFADRFLRFSGFIGAFALWRAGNISAYLLFISAVCAASLLGNIAVPSWFGWLASIVPQEVQGSFWGRRDAWISLAVIAVILPSGLLMDLVPPGGKLEVAAAILSAAGLVGFVDLFIHVTIPEPRIPRVGGSTVISNILKPLRDRRFRPWLVFTACWSASLALGGSLCTLYFMENLGFKHDLLGGMIAISAAGLVTGLLTARRGGRLVDRWGVRKVLFISHALWSVVPVFWLFAVPETAILWVGLSNVVLGTAQLTANNVSVKLVTRFPSPEDSSMYMAVSNSVANIAAGLGSLAAGITLDLIGTWSFALGRAAVSGFPIVFAASASLRLASVLVLVPRIRERGEAPVDRRRFLLPLFFRLPRRRD